MSCSAFRLVKPVPLNCQCPYQRQCQPSDQRRRFDSELHRASNPRLAVECRFAYPAYPYRAVPEPICQRALSCQRKMSSTSSRWLRNLLSLLRELPRRSLRSSRSFRARNSLRLFRRVHLAVSRAASCAGVLQFLNCDRCRWFQRSESRTAAGLLFGMNRCQIPGVTPRRVPCWDCAQ